MFLVTSKFQIQKVNASMLIFEGVKRHCLVNCLKMINAIFILSQMKIE